MNKKLHYRAGISRRRFIGSATTAAAALTISPSVLGSTFPAEKPDSNFSGVQIGAISYSWREMSNDATDILKYCVEGNISSIELMGNVAEGYAGIPPLPPRLPRNATDEEKNAYQMAADEAREKQREWR